MHDIAPDAVYLIDQKYTDAEDHRLTDPVLADDEVDRRRNVSV
jgi:hypothetical protein